MALAQRVEYACERKMRTRNKGLYRLTHWPIWILVFFLSPGPLTLDLFSGRAGIWNGLWLIAVLVGTGAAVCRGCLPGTEAVPYILRFTEDRPNPLYRRICYGFAWNLALSYAGMNLIGLALAVVTGRWHIELVYKVVSPPMFLLVALLGVTGRLPRVRSSTLEEATDRRLFYGTVWAVTMAQGVLLALSAALPRNHATDVIKLTTYVVVLGVVGVAAHLGSLPRTRPIVAGEVFAAD